MAWRIITRSNLQRCAQKRFVIGVRHLSASEMETTSQELAGSPINPVSVAIADFKEVTSTAFARPFAAVEGFNPSLPHPANPSVAAGFVPPDVAPDVAKCDMHPGVPKKETGQLESVIDDDGRDPVARPSAWPWCVQGKMFMTFPDGARFIGSGTLVNRHHVLTAGHCIYSHRNGGWATRVEFIPAMRFASRPFGSSLATRLVSVAGWTDRNPPLRAHDIGMLILDQNIGDVCGHFGVVTTENNSLLLGRRVNVTGYPGDLDRGRVMYTMADAIKRVQADELNYFIDTFGGQSGSGVWSHWSGHPGFHVCGVHVRGVGRAPDNDNDSTRITRVKFDRIVEWMNQW
eukprot:m.445734 g.445734  ORF g.445734 m.445734 type:complete len:345 (+) comp19271_c0_seq1:74-1108(+)